MPSNWHELAVGQPLFPGRPGPLPEPGQYNYYHGGHELQLVIDGIEPRELVAVRRGDCEFAVAVVEGVIFLLYTFHPVARGDGVAIDWSDMPFQWHLVPAPFRALPPATGPAEHAVLLVMLAEARTGLISALRQVSLSPEFTARLHQEIRLQAGGPAPDSPDAHQAHVEDIYRRYPTAQSLLAVAVTRCRGGT